MRKIDKILKVEKRTAGKGGYVTYAVVGGDECSGWSAKKDEYKVGDLVMVGFDDHYNKAKFWKELPVDNSLDKVINKE